MIVCHDKVEIEICFLGQHAADGIFDSTDPVAYRNDDGGLTGKIFGTEVYLVEFIGSQICFRCSVQAFSISICTVRFFGST